MDADDFSAALAALPHGPSFRFIDALDALVPGDSGSARYTVTGREPFLEGHFPGNPLLPGVILVEALAQLAGVVAQSDLERAPLEQLRLTAIRQAKITGSAQPGDTLEISATIEGRHDHLVQATGVVRVGEQVVLRAQVVLSGEK